MPSVSRHPASVWAWRGCRPHPRFGLDGLVLKRRTGWVGPPGVGVRGRAATPTTGRVVRKAGTGTLRGHEAGVLHPRCPRPAPDRRAGARDRARLPRCRVARPPGGTGAPRPGPRRTGRGGGRVQGDEAWNCWVSRGTRGSPRRATTTP
ncbi:hypothetical protein LV779_03430 [Streptomyces thinghirensis]|nr:hypothetical protein [Streptomyces thinghirensis]